MLNNSNSLAGQVGLSAVVIQFVFCSRRGAFSLDTTTTEQLTESVSVATVHTTSHEVPRPHVTPRHTHYCIFPLDKRALQPLS